MVLPFGVVLGRCTVDDVRSALAGQIPLEAYRGRSAYPQPAQAAEAYVRAATGLGAVDAVAGVEPAGPGRWSVLLADGTTRLVEVVESTGPDRKESCRKPALPSPLDGICGGAVDPAAMRAYPSTSGGEGAERTHRAGSC